MTQTPARIEDRGGTGTESETRAPSVSPCAGENGGAMRTLRVGTAVAAFSLALALPLPAAQAQTTATPPGRIAARMAYDAARQEVVLFGGLDGTGFPLVDTWIWNGTNWTERHPAPSPSSRYNPAVAYDGARKEVVLFGGSTGSGSCHQQVRAQPKGQR